MELSEVHAQERMKWGMLARVERPDEALLLPPDLDFHKRALAFTTLSRIDAFLGDLRGKKVVEYGCGLGLLTTLLARSGAHVHAFDLSPDCVAVARRRAVLNGAVRGIEFRVAAASSLPYDDETFDVAVGNSVLGLLSIKDAAPELLRVLKPGAKAAFAEPLGLNPVLGFARSHLPYPDKKPRERSHALSYEDIEGWEAGFSLASHEEVQLLSMVERAFGHATRFDVLRALDTRLLSRMPRLRKFCRYVVLRMVK